MDPLRSPSIHSVCHYEAMPVPPTATVSNGPATVQTQRLRLDPPVPGDAAAVLAIAGDPRTVEHNPSDLVADRSEADALVERWIRHWELRGFGYWCVRERDRTSVVGYCGVKSMEVRGQPVLNLIYRFRPEVWGRGYATEAARAAITWAGAHQPESTILARVRPSNGDSRRVALKAGLHRDPALDNHGEDGLDLAFSNSDVRSA